jgi:hypothetical protein
MLNAHELTLEQRIAIAPQSTWLTFSDAEQNAVWQQVTANSYTNENARDQAYQNLLCLRVFRQWLSEAVDSELQSVSPLLPETAIASTLDIVNGIALAWGKVTITLVPSCASVLEELRVPQEWVDIPSWATHYYIGVQIDLESQWLCILGYAPHAKILQGNYDPIDRTYSLAQDELIQDLNVLLSSQFIATPAQPIVSPLPLLSESTATQYIKQLSSVTAYSPRLDLPFTAWAAIAAHPDWRQRLHQQRSPSPMIRLSKWAQGIFETGWRSARELAAPSLTQATAKGSQDLASGETEIQLEQYRIALFVSHQALQNSGAAQPTVKVQLQAKLLNAVNPVPALKFYISEISNADLWEEELQLNTPWTFDCKKDDEFTLTLRLESSRYSQSFKV